MGITKQEKTIKELFVGKCWSYLNDNFHKFSESSKIEIVLELSKEEFSYTIKKARTMIEQEYEEQLVTEEALRCHLIRR